MRKAATHLARQPGLAAWFRQWARLETTAITLYTYECRMIPGLLQTEAYARTLFTNQLPLLDDEQIEAQWVARAERQRLLRSGRTRRSPSSWRRAVSASHGRS